MDNNGAVIKGSKAADEFKVFFHESIERSLFLYCACINELSPAESDVVKELIKGRTVRDIARARHISPKTVSVQKISAMKKMKLSSDIELVHYFYFLQKKLKNIICYI